MQLHDYDKIRDYFDSVADERPKWRKRAGYFHKELRRYVKFLIPENSSVLEIGCETGDLLAQLSPKRGVGIDSSRTFIETAAKNFPHLEFKLGDLDNIEKLEINEKFDYIIVGSVIGYVDDIQNVLSGLKKFCKPETRILVSYYNYLWEPILKFAEMIRLRMRRPIQHWLSTSDLENFLYIAGFELVKKKNYFLIPFYVPLLSTFFNKFFANLGFFRKLSLVQILITRLPHCDRQAKDFSCSVIVPCRNERGNIEQVILRMPLIGKHTEIIFVEGHSKDGTYEECLRVKSKYSSRDIKVMQQDGEGKADAVRKGLSYTQGDIFMILDADLGVSPEELPKFFDALISNKGEFINGSRLVYSRNKQVMRFLNILGNKFFSFMFTFLLEQYLKDTLCGTKALWKQDYYRILSNREYFTDIDPFGDFDLLFGAAKLNLKIVEVPVHYYERSYGSTQIRRFRHGWLLLKMAFLAMGKLRFI
ncbi:MAG: glycosyltransferase [Candidatus Omnitrophica bacterium]|nr:glycosyltransferase [Candidatus Omnitrophota bacterium]